MKDLEIHKLPNGGWYWKVVAIMKYGAHYHTSGESYTLIGALINAYKASIKGKLL